jgi:hypothetical protein
VADGEIGEEISFCIRSPYGYDSRSGSSLAGAGRAGPLSRSLAC